MEPNDLNRFIAEHRGWTDFEMDRYWEETFDNTSEINCWFGFDPVEHYRKPVPDYTRDLAAAWVFVGILVHWGHEFVTSPNYGRYGPRFVLRDKLGGIQQVVYTPQYGKSTMYPPWGVAEMIAMAYKAAVDAGLCPKEGES